MSRCDFLFVSYSLHGFNNGLDTESTNEQPWYRINQWTALIQNQPMNSLIQNLPTNSHDTECINKLLSNKTYQWQAFKENLPMNSLDTESTKEHWYRIN